MKKDVYFDRNGNELEVYLNSTNELFLRAGDANDDYFNGYIVLDKEDVSDLIKDLQELLKLM